MSCSASCVQLSEQFSHDSPRRVFSLSLLRCLSVKSCKPYNLLITHGGSAAHSFRVALTYQHFPGHRPDAGAAAGPATRAVEETPHEARSGTNTPPKNN